MQGPSPCMERGPGVHGVDNMDVEELETEVFNDRKFGNDSGRKSHFLGRVKLYGSQFAKRGEGGLVYFPLEKKSVFSWIR
ncbi:hypothetical protein Goari_015869, partial [Gossypium aridum]|nr:hypothetical protein [Gossypium aridum]